MDRILLEGVIGGRETPDAELAEDQHDASLFCNQKEIKSNDLDLILLLSSLRSSYLLDARGYLRSYE